MLYGNNDCGQLGTGNNENSKKFIILSGYCFQKIACGFGFVIAFTDNFDYFGWGRNSWGQLGLGQNNDCNSPQQIHLNLQVSFFCLVITQLYRLIDEQNK